MANPNIVSVTSIYAGNAGWNLSGTATTTLLTVAADVIVKINAITCANVDGTNAATLNLYIDGVGTTVTGVTGTGLATTIYLAKTINVPADDILVVIDRPIYLMENDILKGGASAAGDLDLYIDGVGTTVTGVTGTALATTIYLAKTISIPADDILVVIDRPIYMMEGDILKGGASASGDLDLYMSYEVINDA